MFWVALWVSSFTLSMTTDTLAVNGNAYESASSTGMVVMQVLTELGDVEDATYRVFRAKEQGVTFNANGSVKLSLKAGTPVENLILWNQNNKVKTLPQSPADMSQGINFSIAGSSTSLVNYIQGRHTLRGEVCRVYLASQELKIKPEFNLWVR